MQYVLMIDNQYYTDKGMLWNSNIAEAKLYSNETAVAIKEHWMKYNTVLRGRPCNTAEIVTVN